MKSDPVSIGPGTCVHETPKALLCETTEHGRIWIPKNQIHDDSEVWKVAQSGNIVVLERFAEFSL